MNKRKTKVIAYVLDSLEHQLIPLGDCRKPCSVSPSACPSHLSSICMASSKTATIHDGEYAYAS